MRRTFLGVISVLLIVVGWAGAHPVTTNDPENDAGPTQLDISDVVQNHGKRSGSRFVTFRLETYSSFENGDLRTVADEHFAITIYVFTDDKDAKYCKADRSINIGVQEDSQASDGWSPVAFVVKGGCAQPTGDTGKPPSGAPTLGFAQVWRPTSNSIEVRLPASLIKKAKLKSFWWVARTEWAYSENGSTIVTPDYAPDGNNRKRGHV